MEPWERPPDAYHGFTQDILLPRGTSCVLGSEDEKLAFYPTTPLTEIKVEQEALTHYQLLQKVALPRVWPKGTRGVWRTEHGPGHH